MKNAVAIVIMSFVSLILVAAAFFVLYSIDPKVFNVQQVPPVETAQPKEQKKDSAATGKVLAKTDSVDTVKKMADSVAAAKKPVMPKELPAPPTHQVAADTTDWKSKAKIFEAMSIDDAAKILHKMKDGEVKSIIVYIKKRNAAKILATFEPERAARIIR